MSRGLQVWARWLALYALITFIFSTVIGAPGLRISHGLLVYLLLIIGASRETRGWLSVVMVAGGYLAVDWFFVPPVQAFGRPADFDLVLLVGFIVVGVVITRQVATLNTAVRLATARAAEIETLGQQQLEHERAAVRTRESKESDEMKTALIASIAHDLRSPITTVKMLADPEYDIPPRLALRRISDEADRMNRYLSTMRHFSALGVHGLQMHVESHVVDDLVGTALASYAGVLRGRALTVRASAEGEILLVRCDLTLSLQVLGNLLENAARHSPPSTPIELWCERDGHNVHIVVADRGPGVPLDEAELIFKARYFGSTGSVHGGQGMGLAIARTFARAQLGDVQYRARAGGGAQFSFTLPLSTAPADEHTSLGTML